MKTAVVSSRTVAHQWAVLFVSVTYIQNADAVNIEYTNSRMNGRIYDKKDSLGIPFYMPFTEHIELRVEQIDSRNIDKGLSLRNTSKGGCREFRFLNTVYVKSAGKKNFMKVLTHLEAMQKRLKVEM